MLTIKLLSTYVAFTLAGCGTAVLLLSVLLALDRANLLMVKSVGAIPWLVFRFVIALLLTAVFVLAFLFWLIVDKESAVLPTLFMVSFVGTSILLRLCYQTLTPDLLAKLNAPRARQ